MANELSKKERFLNGDEFWFMKFNTTFGRYRLVKEAHGFQINDCYKDTPYCYVDSINEDAFWFFKTVFNVSASGWVSFSDIKFCGDNAAPIFKCESQSGEISRAAQTSLMGELNKGNGSRTKFAALVFSQPTMLGLGFSLIRNGLKNRSRFVEMVRAVSIMVCADFMRLAAFIYNVQMPYRAYLCSRVPFTKRGAVSF